MGLSGHRRHRTPRCRSSTRDVSIRRGLEDPTWDSVGVGGTGLLRRRSIRHGLQDPTGTLGRRSAHDPSVPLDEGCLESVRASGADAESGASERTGSVGAARRGRSLIGAGLRTRFGTQAPTVPLDEGCLESVRASGPRSAARVPCAVPIRHGSGCGARSVMRGRSGPRVADDVVTDLWFGDHGHAWSEPGAVGVVEQYSRTLLWPRLRCRLDEEATVSRGDRRQPRYRLRCRA